MISVTTVFAQKKKKKLGQNLRTNSRTPGTKMNHIVKLVRFQSNKYTNQRSGADVYVELTAMFVLYSL
jgi:hypothetical protein